MISRISSSLKISDLRIWVHLGCSDEEKSNPQQVSFDIVLNVSSPPNGAENDDLGDTICYRTIVEAIIENLKNKRFNLIEHLTYRVFEIIKNYVLDQQQNYVSSITVVGTKISPPVPGINGGVSFSYSNSLQ